MASKAVVALLAALLAVEIDTRVGAAGPVASDPARIVPWHTIGSVTLGMRRAEVERVYGRPYYPGLGWEAPQYNVRGGVFFIEYGPCDSQGPHCRGRVVDVSTNSARYRTKSGLGVGTRIPFPACKRRSAGRCVRTWKGWRLGSHPLTGVPVWWRWARYAGRPVTAYLDVTGAGPAPYRRVGIGRVFQIGVIDRRVPASEWRS